MNRPPIMVLTIRRAQINEHPWVPANDYAAASGGSFALRPVPGASAPGYAYGARSAGYTA